MIPIASIAISTIYFVKLEERFRYNLTLALTLWISVNISMLPFLFIDLFILSSLCFQNKIEIILFAIMVLSTFLLIAVFPGVSSLIISEITDRDLFLSLKMKFIRIFPAAWTISSIVSYFIFWLFAFNYVYLSPIMYLIVTNGYFVNIVSNIIAKSSISDHPISMLLRSLYLGLLIYNLIKNIMPYYHLLNMDQEIGYMNIIYLGLSAS